MGPPGMLRVAGLSLLALVAATVAQARPERVLIIQSFARGLEPYTIFTSAFREELVRISPEPIEFHEVSLEFAVSDAPPRETAFVDYLIALDADRRFDLVAAVGGPALRFVQRNRPRLFPTTSVLIAGVDVRHLDGVQLTEHDAVAPVRFDLRAVIDDIVRLLPETESVIVVTGRSPLERFWTAAVREEFRAFAGRLRPTFVDDLSLDEIVERCATLPHGTAIYFLLMIVDAEGRYYDGERGLREVCASAGAPVFGVFEHQLGLGIVGGPLFPTEAAGRESAAAAGRVLAGEAPSRVRVAPLGMAAPSFDWRQLERWGIDAARLPPGSVIRFRPPTLWEDHERAVLVISAVGALSTALIALLLAALHGRRKAEEDLRKSRERFALAIEGSRDGVWDWDLRTGKVFLSPRGKEILGYDEHEEPIRVATWDGRVRAEDHERVTAALREHVDTRSPAYAVEYHVTTPDGGERVVLTRGKALLDGDGRAYRVAGSVTDVTQRRRAERAVRDVNRRMIVVQEKERGRLARELHDDVTQRMARLAIDAGRIEAAHAGSEDAEPLRELRLGLARLSEDIHALSYRLHPSLLDDLGLPDALQAECDRFTRQTAVPVTLGLDEVPPDLPRDVSICLYRVVQESLRNVARHARARRVTLTLNRLDGGLQLGVRDDGVGFDLKATRNRPTLGQASMRERVHLVGGEIDVASATGHGTTIVAWVPLAGAGR